MMLIYTVAFEERIASRWSDAYRGEPPALRTVTKIRRLCMEYASARGYEFVIVDTSPSLGIMNKVIISTVVQAPDLVGSFRFKSG